MMILHAAFINYLLLLIIVFTYYYVIMNCIAVKPNAGRVCHYAETMQGVLLQLNL